MKSCVFVVRVPPNLSKTSCQPTVGDQPLWIESCTMQNCGVVYNQAIWKGMGMWGREGAPFCQIQHCFSCVELILSQRCPKWANVQSWVPSIAWTGFISHLLSTQVLELPFQMEPEQAEIVLSGLHFPAIVTTSQVCHIPFLPFFFLSLPLHSPSRPFLSFSPVHDFFMFFTSPSSPLSYLLSRLSLYILGWLPTWDPSVSVSLVLEL